MIKAHEAKKMALEALEKEKIKSAINTIYKFALNGQTKCWVPNLKIDGFQFGSHKGGYKLALWGDGQYETGSQSEGMYEMAMAARQDVLIVIERAIVSASKSAMNSTYHYIESYDLGWLEEELRGAGYKVTIEADDADDIDANRNEFNPEMRSFKVFVRW